MGIDGLDPSISIDDFPGSCSEGISMGIDGLNPSIPIDENTGGLSEGISMGIDGLKPSIPIDENTGGLSEAVSMGIDGLDPSIPIDEGTRLLITRLGSHVLEGRIITGTNSGERVIIPRLSLTPSDVKVPFKFQRRQFPVMISYAMTINKSQGQSLSQVGLYLKQSVFSHGQFYVAVSRVTNPRGLKILLFGEEDEEKKHAVNVVYKEIFENL
ncbi:hypothetical protein CASFOL_002582 [Castilleja foliolosa]|uniref:ATP-dependent DNA helicase n=1 Tax=Castilleja foliolosa TaxID=1961234 RepID=A0ABD3EI72_9LAMI